MTTTELLSFLGAIKAEADHGNMPNLRYELEKLIHNLEVEGIEEDEDQW